MRSKEALPSLSAVSAVGYCTGNLDRLYYLEFFGYRWTEVFGRSGELPCTDYAGEESPDSAGQDVSRVFGGGPLPDRREWKAPQKTNRHARGRAIAHARGKGEKAV